MYPNLQVEYHPKSSDNDDNNGLDSQPVPVDYRNSRDERPIMPGEINIKLATPSDPSKKTDLNASADSGGGSNESEAEAEEPNTIKERIVDNCCCCICFRKRDRKKKKPDRHHHPGEMRWCTFVFFISTRMFNYVMAHIMWAFTIYSGCAYYQDNIFLTAAKLIVKKKRDSSKPLRELFKEIWIRDSDEAFDVETEDPKENKNPLSSRLAAAVSLALLLLRARVSIAMLTGKLNHVVNPPPSKTEYRLYEWDSGLRLMFSISLYSDLFSLWLLILWAWCRNCRLCCMLGCCKYYLWMLLVLMIGLFVMEIPMSVAHHFYSERSWCTFNYGMALNATADFIKNPGEYIGD